MVTSPAPASAIPRPTMLWLRKDLMEKAGIEKIPETWDELRAAAQKMQGGGIYRRPAAISPRTA